jgi:outer membrane protein TolC
MHIYLNPAPNHEFIPPNDGFFNALNLGVTLKYNISSLYGMKGKKQEVRLTIQQAENASALQRDRVRSEVYTEYMAHQSALEKINVAQTALAQSGESLKLSVSQFQNGLLLSGDLMQAQTLKLQAELNLLQARIDSQLAYFNLQKAVGITKQ